MRSLTLVACTLGAVLLLATLASAALPYDAEFKKAMKPKPAAQLTGDSALPTAGSISFANSLRAIVRRSRGAESAKNDKRITSLAAASQAAAARTNTVKARRKAKLFSDPERKTLRSSVKHSHVITKMRKAFGQSGVAQTAEMLRSKSAHDTLENGAVLRAGLDNGLATEGIKEAFIAYDTDARRAQLQIPAQQGTPAQKLKCTQLGWALIDLYFDMVTGEEVQYNEGCAEEDLWMTGISYEDGSTVICEKFATTADLEIDWSVADPFQTTTCWSSAQFSDYCSVSTTSKCTLNGTKAKGTTNTASDPKTWHTTGDPKTGGIGFFLKARDILWEYQGEIHDTCPVVMFYDFGVNASSSMGGTGVCDTGSYGDTNMFGDSNLYPKLCSSTTEKTSASPAADDATQRLMYSSYTRQFEGNAVPREYVFLTYDDWDAEDKPWLISPAPLPMHGKYLLKMMAESVGLACVNDGAATPKYCLKEFYDSLAKMDNILFPALDADPFGDAEVAAVEKVLAENICTDCNGILFNYMYLSWEDASDDDKYLRTFMEMACSSAPDDNGNEQWCLPVLKDMEDESEPQMDTEAADYDATKFEEYVGSRLICGVTTSVSKSSRIRRKTCL